MSVSSYLPSGLHCGKHTLFIPCYSPLQKLSWKVLNSVLVLYFSKLYCSDSIHSHGAISSFQLSFDVRLCFAYLLIRMKLAVHLFMNKEHIHLHACTQKQQVKHLNNEIPHVPPTCSLSIHITAAFPITYASNMQNSRAPDLPSSQYS